MPRFLSVHHNCHRPDLSSQSHEVCFVHTTCVWSVSYAVLLWCARHGSRRQHTKLCAWLAEVVNCGNSGVQKKNRSRGGRGSRGSWVEGVLEQPPHETTSMGLFNNFERESGVEKQIKCCQTLTLQVSRLRVLVFYFLYSFPWFYHFASHSPKSVTPPLWMKFMTTPTPMEARLNFWLHSLLSCPSVQVFFCYIPIWDHPLQKPPVCLAWLNLCSVCSEGLLICFSKHEDLVSKRWS